VLSVGLRWTVTVTDQPGPLVHSRCGTNVAHGPSHYESWEEGCRAIYPGRPVGVRPPLDHLISTWPIGRSRAPASKQRRRALPSPRAVKVVAELHMPRSEYLSALYLVHASTFGGLWLGYLCR
jgi:hypothetical protein